MRDVRERAAVNERRIVFQGLNQVRLQRLLQKHGHCTVCFQVASVDGRAVAAIGNDDVAKALLQVFQIGGKTKDRHDL